VLIDFKAPRLAYANPGNTKEEEGLNMMPLMLAQVGEENIIKKIGGSPEVKQHLENLGFVVGGTVKVVNALGGNVIVNVKESRVAISEEMAKKIMI
jgi:ferrous iron transport protein A